MNFLEAVKAMKEGKKTRMSNNHIIFYTKGNILMSEGIKQPIANTYFFEGNWEVVKK